MKREKTSGHIMALICVVVWGSTFVVSKSLLKFLHPLQLMLARFTLAWLALWVIHPRWYFRWREEGRFLLMALFANTLYCWAENTAITLTQTSNVSILVSTTPIITAVVMAVFHREERLSRGQALGFGVAFLGVVLVVFNGAVSLHLNPAGDLLALGAAAAWSAYGMLLRRWSGEYDSVLITRKLMFYGALTVLPMVLALGQPYPFRELLAWESMAKLGYLGLVGSATCYLFWGKAVQRLGVLSANLYIYAVPLVTLLVGWAVLHETITPMGLAGIALVIGGMILGTVRGGK